MNSEPGKIFIIAGESSGDMHAASLLTELKRSFPGLTAKGIGGQELKAAGAELIFDKSKVSYIGFSAVIKNIRKLKKIITDTKNFILKFDPDILILVDFPGFNLKIASGIRKSFKGKIVYYISPQLWAWHKSRVKVIRETVDLMIVVFPFEVEFYKKENVKANFAGHPLIKRTDAFLSENKKEESKRLNISFMPGSRKDEIRIMMPLMVETAELFKKEFDCNINIICSDNFELSFYKPYLKDNKFSLVRSDGNDELNYKTILNSDLVITKSGTSTMECALIGTPFCVVYKTGAFNYAIGKRLIQVDHIAMINILLGRTAVKEFLQEKMKPEDIFEEGRKILTDNKYRGDMLMSFKELRSVLTDKNASANAAEMIAELMKD
ncbi:MAG: lipid-A-disaccharide synthase [Ignavibacteria bacterium]|nr:lipid-A-disaccharide synthase [Ignavibacteria bacterium]